VSVAETSKWVNPIKHVRPRREAVRLYREYLKTRPDLLGRLSELERKDLACNCPLDDDCHADVLLDLANPMTSAGPSWTSAPVRPSEPRVSRSYIGLGVYSNPGARDARAHVGTVTKRVPANDLRHEKW